MVSENHVWWRDLIKATADQTGTSSQAYNDYGQWACLAYQMTGDTAYAAKAWDQIEPQMSGIANQPPGTWNITNWSGNWVREVSHEYVLMYDWLYPTLTPAQRTTFLNGLNRLADYCLGINMPQYTGGFRLGDGDQSQAQYWFLALMDLATGPENPRAGTFLSSSANNGAIPIGGLDATAADWASVRNYIKFRFSVTGDGGTWNESSEYNPGTLKFVLRGVMGTRTATGLDHFPEASVFSHDAALSQIYSISPDLKTAYQWGDDEHPNGFVSRLPWEGMSYMGALYRMNKENETGPFMRRLVDDLVQKYGPTGYSSAQPGAQFFYAYNPYAPAADWRPIVPKGHFSAGMGISYFHDGWSANDSFFIAQTPHHTEEDHNPAYSADKELYRHGEWALVHPIAYGGPVEAKNTVVIAGMGSMAEFRGPIEQEYGSNDEYAYLAGGTRGSLEPSGYYNPPPTYLNEWTESIFYLPSSDKHSDTIVVFDRVDSKNPQNLANFNSYSAIQQATIKAAPALKQWIIHMPVSPTVSTNGLSWQTAGGQNISVRTLLPENSVKSIYDENALAWDSVPSSEKHFHVRIWPAVEQEWDTFLNVIQAADSGTNLTNTLVQSNGLEAQGVLVQRTSLPDTLVMFGASPSQRLVENGYTVTWNSGSVNTMAYFIDLDPGTNYSSTLDGISQPLTISASGIGKMKISGTGTHTVVINGVPSAPVITRDLADQAVSQGQSLSLSVGIRGSQPLTFQWQRSGDNGNTWMAISGANSNPYSFVAKLSDNNSKFRVVTNNNLGTVTSRAALLTVTAGSSPSPASPATPPSNTNEFTHQNFFNPTHGESIYLPCKKTGGLTRICDRFGKTVRQVTNRPDGTGCVAIWDGRNESGEIAASGLYFTVEESSRDRHKFLLRK